MGLRSFLKRLRLKSVQAGDGQRPVDNVDARAAAGQSARSGPTTGPTPPANFPPNYVPPADEGRPPH